MDEKTKKLINELSEKHGISRTEVEDMIKISDFKDTRDFMSGNEIEEIFKKGGDIKIDLPGEFYYYFTTFAIKKGFVRFQHHGPIKHSGPGGSIMKDEIYNIKRASSEALLLQKQGRISIFDFIDDGNTFKTDKSRTKWDLVGTLAEAYNVWQNALKKGDKETIERAAKVYWDLKSYITADFTDDRGFPTVSKLISLMDQIYNILARRGATFSKETERLVMSDERSDKNLADKLYNHRLIKEDLINAVLT